MKFSNNKRMKTGKVRQDQKKPFLGGQKYQTNPNWKNLDDSSVKVEQVGNSSRIYTQKSGVHTAVFGSVPCQLRDSAGCFRKIDNSIVCEPMNAGHGVEILQNHKGEYYHNEFNVFKAYFPKLLDKKVFTMIRDQYAISFELLNQQDNEQLAPTGRLKGCLVNKFGQTAKASSQGNSLLYSDFEENSDLEYCVQDQGVKENIILRSKREEYRFAFVAELTNLEMRRGRDGSILLVSTIDKEKEMFRIPAPVMYDAEQHTSSAVRYHYARMSKGSNRYLLVLDASKEWINAEGRVFPVVIDPQVNLAMDPNDLSESLVWVEKIEGTYVPVPPVSDESGCPDDACPDDDIVCDGDGNDLCCDDTCGSGCCDEVCGDGVCGDGTCKDCNCDCNCDLSDEDIVFDNDCVCGDGVCGESNDCVSALNENEDLCRIDNQSNDAQDKVSIVFACEEDEYIPDYENNPTQPGYEYCPDCENNPTQPNENVYVPPAPDPYPWQKFAVSRYGGSYSDLKFTVKNPMSTEAFSNEEMRVLKASLIWPMYQMNGYVHFQVKNTANGRVVEDDVWVNKKKPAELYIDVTSVLNDMIQENIDTVELLMTVVDEGEQNEYIMFLNAADSLQLLIDYIPQREVEEKSEHYGFEVAGAGSGNICLSTGKTVFAHTDMTAGGSLMPISVSHVFNSHQKGLTKGKIGTSAVTPDYGMGKGWKLNVQQSLIVPGRNVPFRADDALNDDRVHYLDAGGNDHVFEKKYYYMQNGCKVFVDEEELLVDANKEPITDVNGNYAVNIDGVKQVVYQALMSGCGLQLETDEDKSCYFNGKHHKKFFVQNGEKKYLTLRTDGNYDYEAYVAELWSDQYQIDPTFMYKKGTQNTVTILSTEYDVSVTTKVATLLKDDRGEYFEVSLRGCDGNTELVRIDVLSEFDEEALVDFSGNTLSEEVLQMDSAMNELNSQLTDMMCSRDQYASQLNGLLYPNVAQQRLEEAQEEYQTTSREKNGQENEKDEAVFEKRLANLQEQYNQLDALAEAKKSEYDDLLTEYNQYSAHSSEAKAIKLELIALYNEYRGYEISRDSTQISMEETRHNKGLITTYTGILQNAQTSVEDHSEEVQRLNEDTQIGALRRLLNKLNEKLDLMLKIRAKRAREYEAMISSEKKKPCDIIVDETGNKLAFDFYGRLVAVQDASENAVAFLYDDDHRLIKIVNDDERESLLQYDKNGCLTSMTDVDGRVTAFVYTANCELSEIRLPEYDSEHPDALISFAYGENGDLADITDRSGYGLRLTYGTKTITLRDYTKTQIISEDGVQKAAEEIAGDCVEICFNSAFLTTVKTKRLTTTYQFDLAGNLVASHDVYEEEPGIRNATCVYREKNRVVTTKVGEDAKDALAEFAFPGEWTLCGFEPKGDKAICNGSGGYCYVSKTLQGEDLTALGDRKNWVLSVMAKATSAQIDTERVTGEEEKDGEAHINTELFDEDAKRKFGISASVTYVTGITEDFYASFDWYNTDWQLCQLPILLDEKEEPERLTVQFRYDYNCGAATVKQIQLLAGDATEQLYSNDDKLLKETDKTYCYTYEYNGTPYPVKVTRTRLDNDEKKVNKYGYNSKHQLLWCEDYNGMMTKHTYDEKGHRIKSVTYHESDPSSKFYTESVYDEQGRESENMDARGTVNGVKLASKKTYFDGTDTLKSVQYPNGAVTEYGYHHLSGALISMTADADGVDHSNRAHLEAGYTVKVDNPSGMWYNYTYDGFGRVLHVDINGKTCVTYTHSEETDAEGKKRFVDTATLPGCDTVTTVTDLRGRVKQVSCGEQVIKQVTKRTPECVEYTETLTDGTRRSHRVLTGESEIAHHVGHVKYIAQKDEKQRVTKARYIFSETVAQKYGYTYDNAKEQLTALCWNDELEQKYTYDVYGRLTDTKTSCGEAALNCKVQYLKCGDHMTDLVTARIYKDKQGIATVERYGYNAAGHIENVTENGKLKVRYTYDKLDRLIREDNKALGITTVFLYDNGGNLLCQREFEYGLDDVEDLLVRDEVLYGYANSDRPDQLTSFNGEKIAYNENGMPTIYRGNTCTYTRGTLLATFGENTFAYDADGLRTRKNGTVYTYLNGKLLREVGPDGVIDFIYGVDGIMGISYKNAVYLFRKNVFGDVTHIYDTEGDLKARYIYDAWGNHKVVNVDEEDPIGEINPIRYRSYYYDDEIGLYYLRARYYDPEIGRFISQDNISYLDSEHLSGLNLYAYCNDDPVMLIDDSGCAPKWWQWVVSSVAIVGGAILCATGVATGLGVSLLVAGGSMMGSNIMDAAGVDSKTACIVSSVVDIAAGAVLCATPFAAVGASMIGSGVGGLFGGFAGEAAGLDFEVGATVGSFVGGILGGTIHKTLVNAGKISTVVKANTLKLDPANPMTDEGINYWTKTLSNNHWKGYNTLPNAYGLVEPIHVQKGTMLVANGHHRITVLMKYTNLKYIRVFFVP